jgi:hypothetical protein
MTNDDIKAFAAEMAEAAAKIKAENLEHATPAQLGYPGMTAEQVIEAEYQHWIKMDRKKIIRMMKDREEMRECWRKQDEQRAAMKRYFDGISSSDLKHPAAAEMVRRTIFIPRYADQSEADLERFLNSGHACPALAVIHEDDDSICLQIELPNDYAAVISFCKHTNLVNPAIRAGGLRAQDSGTAPIFWKRWLTISSSMEPRQSKGCASNFRRFI